MERWIAVSCVLFFAASANAQQQIPVNVVGGRAIVTAGTIGPGEVASQVVIPPRAGSTWSINIAWITSKAGGAGLALSPAVWPQPAGVAAAWGAVATVAGGPLTQLNTNPPATIRIQEPPNNPPNNVGGSGTITLTYTVGGLAFVADAVLNATDVIIDAVRVNFQRVGGAITIVGVIIRGRVWPANAIANVGVNANSPTIVGANNIVGAVLPLAWDIPAQPAPPAAPVVWFPQNPPAGSLVAWPGGTITATATVTGFPAGAGPFMGLFPTATRAAAVPMAPGNPVLGPTGWFDY